jgi:hypothetical protein
MLRVEELLSQMLRVEELDTRTRLEASVVLG